jgi:hypothetical protein
MSDMLQADQFGDRDKALLDAAGQPHKTKQRRSAAMSEAYGDADWRAVSRMNQLIDHPDAQAYAPETVHTLRAERDKARTRR